MSDSPLDALMAEIGRAFKSAIQATEVYGMNAYLDHFHKVPSDEAGGGTKLVPKTVSLPIPNGKGGYESHEVPTAALVRHNCLQMEEIRIKLRVAISKDERNQELRADVQSSKKHDSSKEQPGDMAEVEICFKRGDPPEGVGRITDHFCKQL